MGTAKQIEVRPISAKDANDMVRRLHYSGKVAPNSQLHFGVFLGGRCGGVMSFGPSMVKARTVGLVSGTAWNGFLELNRMAFADWLPRNSESRALAVAFRLIRKHYPHIEWCISFADATQCGDGAIYRASGFVLTSIKKNTTMHELPSGEVVANMTYTKGRHILGQGGKAPVPQGARPLAGFQLRYIYFVNPDARARLTVPVIPFEEIERRGASMYRGKRPTKANSADQVESGGAIPTRTLQILEGDDA
jgi:hypothetical protein